MSDILWPAELQQVLNTSGFANQFVDTVIRTQMDSGPDKIRRRSTTGPEPIKGSILIPTSLYATMKSFYDTDTAGGSLEFLWAHPITRDPAYFRFTAPPDITPVGAGGLQWNVDLALEIVP